MMELIEWFWGSALVTIYIPIPSISLRSLPRLHPICTSIPYISPHPYTLIRLSQTSLSTDSVDAIRPNRRGVLVMYGPGV